MGINLADSLFLSDTNPRTTNGPGNFQTVANNPDLFQGIEVPTYANSIQPGLDDTLGEEPLDSNPSASFYDLLHSGYGSGKPQGLNSGGGNSLIDRFTNGNGQGMADIASVLAALSKGEKANRVTKGNFTQNYDQLMMQAQGARNSNESDALGKLATTNYLKSGGAHYSPATIQLGGQQRTLPNFSFAPKDASPAQIQGATDLEAQLLERLKPGGSYQPQSLDSYANPGTMENIGNYGALATGGLGALQSSGGASDVLSGIGKGVSIAKQIPWSKLISYFGGGGDGGE